MPELLVELRDQLGEVRVLQRQLVLVGVVHVDELAVARGVVGLVPGGHCAQAVPQLVLYGLADRFVVVLELVHEPQFYQAGGWVAFL